MLQLIESVNQIVNQHLILEYSEKFIKQLIVKFKQENSNLSEQNIRHYIERFEKYKDHQEIKEKDILKHSWKDLEQIVDGIINRDHPIKDDSKISGDVNKLKIFEKNGVSVYKGHNKHDCILLNKDIKASWCISRSESQGGNLFNSYRYDDNEPIFYFIRDVNRIDDEDEEEYSASVLHVSKDGSLNLTNKDNSGDHPISFKDLFGIYPELKEIKDQFTHVPISDSDKKLYNKFKNIKMTSKVFKELPYDEKEFYLDTNFEPTEFSINKDVFDYLLSTKQLKKILNNYIRRGGEIQLSFLKTLSQKDLQFIVKYKPEAIQFINNPSDDLVMFVLNKDINFISEVVKVRNNLSEKIQLFVVKEYPTLLRVLLKINPSESIQLEAIRKKPDLIKVLLTEKFIPTERVLLMVLDSKPEHARLIVESKIDLPESVQLKIIKSNRNLVHDLLVYQEEDPTEAIQLEAVKMYKNAIYSIMERGIEPSVKVEELHKKLWGRIW